MYLLDKISEYIEFHVVFKILCFTESRSTLKAFYKRESKRVFNTFLNINLHLGVKYSRGQCK